MVVLFSIGSTFRGRTAVMEMFCKGWAQVMRLPLGVFDCSASLEFCNWGLKKSQKRAW